MDTKKIFKKDIVLDAIGVLATIAGLALLIAFLMGAVSLPGFLQWNFSYPTLGP